MDGFVTSLIFSAYNVMMLFGIITESQIREIIRNICLDYIYKDIEDSLLFLHKKYPEDKDLKRDIMVNILTKKLLFMELFVKKAIWNKDFSHKIFKEMENLIIRKISWTMSCEGFQLFPKEAK